MKQHKKGFENIWKFTPSLANNLKQNGFIIEKKNGFDVLENILVRYHTPYGYLQQDINRISL